MNMITTFATMDVVDIWYDEYVDWWLATIPLQERVCALY